jgi:hypothetical protein
MSNLFDSNTNNPYASSYAAPQQQAPRTQASLPGYCTTMFVISLIFSVLRIASTGFSILGMYMLSQAGAASPLASNAIWEVLTGAGMMISGIIGNSLMLARKPVGLYFGYMLIFFVLSSFLVAIIQTVTLFNMQGAGVAGSPQQAQLIGMVVGASVVIVFRLALVGAYVIALVKFKQWCDVNR